MKRRLRGVYVALAILGVFLCVPSASALETTEPPAILPNSPLYITAFGLDGATAERLTYIEIYNNSNELVSLDEWHLSVAWSVETTAPIGTVPAEPFTMPVITKASPDDPDLYLQPKQYVVLSFGDTVSGATLRTTEQLIGASDTYIASLSLEHENYKPYQKLYSTPQPGGWFLGETTTGYTTTGSYYNFPDSRVRSQSTLYDGGTYQLGIDAPRSFPLAPLEVLANPKNCSPTSKDVTCREYVKFYNDTTMPIDFANTSLVSGSLTSNRQTPLSGVVQPGSYIVFSQTVSGEELNLTNSGGFVWLTDRYGVTLYDSTVTEYADASSTSRKGLSWALLDGQWQWATPSPLGANRALPPPQCKANQFLNELTGRCNNRTTSTLTPCRSDQYRSPETNRCRSLTSSSTSLTPCAANQFRNPETNRCRLVAATTSLSPCEEGKERNPATNRCRTVASAVMPTADYPVESIIDETGSSSVGWLAFGSLGALALGYAGWEWRYEIAGTLRRLQFWGSRK